MPLLRPFSPYVRAFPRTPDPGGLARVQAAADALQVAVAVTEDYFFKTRRAPRAELLPVADAIRNAARGFIAALGTLVAAQPYAVVPFTVTGGPAAPTSAAGLLKGAIALWESTAAPDLQLLSLSSDGPVHEREIFPLRFNERRIF